MSIAHTATCDQCGKSEPAREVTGTPVGWQTLTRPSYVVPATLCSWQCVATYAQGQIPTLAHGVIAVPERDNWLTPDPSKDGPAPSGPSNRTLCGGCGEWYSFGSALASPPRVECDEQTTALAGAHG